MSKVRGNLLASAIECRHISTKLNTKSTGWIVSCCSHPSNPCELLTQWTGSLRLSGMGALLCLGGVCDIQPPELKIARLYPLYQAWGYLNQERNKDLLPFSPCSFAPNRGNIGLVIRRKMDATSRFLEFIPAIPVLAMLTDFLPLPSQNHLFLWR